MSDDNLKIWNAASHEGGCCFCSSREHVTVFTTQHQNGGLLVRICTLCMGELISKWKKLP